MENNQEVFYKPTEPKTIAYDYLFNYFGKGTFKEKIITGASVQLAIRVYKDGKEVKFIEEPNYNKNIDLSDVYRVSFDRNKLFSVNKKIEIDYLFRIAFGWDKIVPEVIGYTLDYLDVMPDEIARDMPEPFKNLPCSLPMEVSEKEFRNFLSKHINDFDISDNVNAQVPSVSYI